MANGVYEHSRVLTGTLSALADNRTGPGATADVSRSISGVSLNVDCLLASCDAFGYRVSISRGRNPCHVVRLGVERAESPGRAGNASGGVKKGEGGTSFPSSASCVLVEVKASALPNWQAF